MSEAPCDDPYAMPPDAVREPPKSVWQALRQIGPGIILAGSIVGTGELLLTTSLGAEYGFAFLWLILFSCVIKVFVQIELGRYAIISGKPTLGAINELPGPRLAVHWMVWWWMFMLLATVFQLGGMTGGVAQALQLAFPQVSAGLVEQLGTSSAIGSSLAARPEYPWAVLTCLTAIGLLLAGGYGLIERMTTVLVVSVTAITVLCVLALPLTGFPLSAEEIANGLAITLPPAGIAVAFGVFGITGVGASELFQYPYWCLEKGYARYVGQRVPGNETAWGERAQGWIRVMTLDAWVSMVVFTIATVAFYFLGATVLYRQGLIPKKDQMIAVLSEMYVPSFGPWTRVAFLIGAWAVLFKTLYVSAAAHSRLTTDFFALGKMIAFPHAASRRRVIRALCVFYPVLALTLYFAVRDPRLMTVIGGFTQAATLPMISGAALYLRYTRTDRRFRGSGVWDVLLWLAFLSITAVACWSMGSTFLQLLQTLRDSFAPPPAA